MPLGEGETPAEAYARKMPPWGGPVTDEQLGIAYRRERGRRARTTFGILQEPPPQQCL